MARSICDKIAFALLTELSDDPNGLRFKEIRKKVASTDPMITSRLVLLKKMGLAEVFPIIDDSHNDKYFVYRITEKGRQVAGGIEVKRLVQTIEQLENVKIMTP